MRLLLPLGGLVAIVVVGPSARRARPALTIPCARDRMAVYQPDLSRIERMPVTHPDTLRVEKMPVARAFCAEDFRRAPTDTSRELPRLLP